MAEQSRLEVGQYDKHIMSDTPTLLATVQAIKAAALTDLPPWALGAYDNVLVKAAALDAEWKKSGEKVANPIRAIDARVDNAWINFYDRSVPWTRIPMDPLAGQGAALFHLLFPGGSRAFLIAGYHTEWAESQKRIEQIQNGHLLDAVKACVGEAFWNELLAAHREYGDALGLTRAKPEADAMQLQDKVVGLRVAIANYGSTLAVCANNDASKAAAIRKALLPIDEARAAAAPAHAAAAPVVPATTPKPA